MSVHPYREEELNHLKYLSLVLNEFPKALRKTFKTMWDTTIGRRPGSQLWDDSTTVRDLFAAEEEGTSKVPTSQSYNEWDCTALFQATIFAKSFRIHSKTLNDLYVKPRAVPHGSFHGSVLRPEGGNETIALAIDQLRRLRNTVFHSSRLEMDKDTFDQNIQYAKEAFEALGISTESIVAIGSLTASDFPTAKVRLMEQQVREQNQAYITCLESANADREEIRGLLTAIKQSVESNKQDVAVLVQRVVKDETSALEYLRMKLEETATKEDFKVLLKEIYELNIKVEAKKTETPGLVNLGDSFSDITVPRQVETGRRTYQTQISGGSAAVGNQSVVNVGTGSQSVLRQVETGRRTYQTQISGGSAAVGNQSVVNVGTGSQSVPPQAATGQRTYQTQISGGNTADQSVVNVGTGSQSVPRQVETGRTTYQTQILGGNAAVGDQSVVNVGTGSQSVPRQVATGQRTYETQISGGNAAVGDQSVVNVGTGSQSVTPGQSISNVDVANGNACTGDQSVINVGIGSPSVLPQVGPGQRTYTTQISGGSAAVGDQSVVNVGTGSQCPP